MSERTPTNRPAEADDGEYDLAPADDPPPPVAALPIAAPHSSVRAVPARDPAAPPALAYQSRREANPSTDPETIKNFWMPVWLLGVGVVVETAAAFLTVRDVRPALAGIAVGLIAGTVTMLAGILLAARWRRIDLGSFRVAVFKLSAVAVAPGAASTLLSPVLNHIPLGGLLGLAFQFVLYFALLGALFDLDQSDTWYCICVILLVRLCIYFALLALAVPL